MSRQKAPRTVRKAPLAAYRAATLSEAFWDAKERQMARGKRYAK